MIYIKSHSLTSEISQVWGPNLRKLILYENQRIQAEICKRTISFSHYTIPLMPELPGLEAFQGFTLHSHSYRVPQTFHDKTVAILGAAASGQDMALDIATEAKHVCHIE